MKMPRIVGTTPRATRLRRRTAAVASALLATGLLTMASQHTAGADEYPAAPLTSTSDTTSWSGEFVAAASGGPEACTPQACDIVPVDVQLPERTWRKPGGMVVAIQATPDIESADLDLFVYAPGCGTLTCEPAAKSTMLLASEAAWIENPVNGRYTVVVAPTWAAGQPFGDGVAEPLVYDGVVAFQSGLTIQREESNFGQDYTRTIIAFGLTERHQARELLPDLVPRAPRNFEIAYGGSDAQTPGGCLPTETLRLHDDEPAPGDGPRTCLRFDQGEYNYGDGPFQLNIYQGEVGGFEVYQRIYSSDGSIRQIGPLGAVEYSESHGHVHYLGFQDLTLHRIEADGSLTFVTRKPDKGWCMVDIWMGRFGTADQRISPSSYPLASEGHCETDSREDPNDPTFPGGKPFIEMGISVGWADIYPRPYPEQYIDITDVVDGDYAVVAQQDVDNHLLETSTKNNTAIGCVRITGDAAEDIPCGTGNMQGVPS